MTTNGGPATGSRLLQRLALHRPELRGWALYDWANSAVVTTIIASVFPIYFYRVAGSGLPDGVATQRFAIATVVAMVCLALLAPALGVIADSRAIKKRLLGIFLAVGASSAALMFFIYPGDWLLALGLFVIVELSVAGTLVFYDSLLPLIARPGEMDRLSATGYALGYLGGGVLLAFNLAVIEAPQWFGLPHGDQLSDAEATLPTRLAFLSVAVWWVIFSVPLFRRVAEPKARPDSAREVGRPLLQTLAQLKTTVGALRTYKEAGMMLLAYLIYNEGIGTIIKMAAIYGAEIGLDSGAMIGSILLVQFIGIPCTLLFGSLAGGMGPRRAIFLGLAVYLGISVLSYAMQSATHFLILAILIGTVQGGTQALSRSLFASLIPKQRSAEFFSLFALSEKLAGMLGPGLFAVMILMTGSSRLAILSVIGFFLVGALLLSRVDIARGQRIAREAEIDTTDR